MIQRALQCAFVSSRVETEMGQYGLRGIKRLHECIHFDGVISPEVFKDEARHWLKVN